MASNAVLATTGDEQVIDAQDLLALLAQPELPPADAPTPAVASDPDNSVTQAAPAPAVTDEIRETVLAQVKNELEVGTAFLTMAPEHQTILAQVAEKLKAGQNPFAEQDSNQLVVSPLDVPSDARLPSISWDELGDDGKYNHALIAATAADLNGKIQQLTAIVTGMQQYLGKVHQQTQDEQIAQAMRLKGFAGCTPEDVRAYRSKGIADPLKAVEAGILTPPKKAAAAQDAPPEAPKGGGAKLFDSNDPKLSIQDINRLLKAGYLPKDPKEREQLLQSRAS